MGYDIKGRFTLVKINEKESQLKLCKVKRRTMGPNKIPYVVTHDARMIRFPNPEIRTFDTLKINTLTGAVESVIKLDTGKNVLVTGVANRGRVGQIVNRTRLQGAFDMIVVKDKSGNSFNTRIDNCFVIGDKDRSLITLPRDQGLKKTIMEEH